ncbi:N-acylglucosamine-6-phosphate 2-epimerase [Actinocorallia herbida]|uniref:Putative N-acetylmannosamine-6-phosphate 2-epimerase n=1 Tax=Actinocorallia herbida TaxID=58109 RepID=A0A3N1CWW1_9ACTN|nr:putative N-acetylmannosamine-6-phosphate 2-epimerase [Actinocorallia herbida]ROO85715.1 N-acylglucosamine-6-phosphate 2-epimerase [Actinocorallia herbida]
MNRDAFLAAVSGRLIVSCQAGHGHPFRDTSAIVRMALAAVEGGAAAIRCGGVGGVADVAAVRAAVDLPVVGLTKDPGADVFITPTVAAALAVVAAGADVVAVDGTVRPRPDGRSLRDTVSAVHEAGRLVMADVATFEDGLYAAAAGADVVGTTLSGYTTGGTPPEEPDLDLVARLVQALPSVPVIAEGRYRTPHEAGAAMRTGALAVVVGTAITDPVRITRDFVRGVEDGRPEAGR